MSKLIKLKVKDVTANYIHYEITIEVKKWYSKNTDIITYRCFRYKIGCINYFTQNGGCVFHKYSHLDNSINAILDLPLTNLTYTL